MTTRKTGRRRRNPIPGAFACRTIEMLKSPAFKVLSLSAHRVLARIEIELAKHGGNDNGKLPITFEQFEEYGIERHAIGPALRELEALGFIQIERGCAGNADHRRPSLYRLSWRGTEDGSPYPQGADEWKRVKTIEDALTIQAEARKTPPENSVRRGGNRVRRASPVALVQK
jgi:hypothetical protein